MSEPTKKLRLVSHEASSAAGGGPTLREAVALAQSKHLDRLAECTADKLAHTLKGMGSALPLTARDGMCDVVRTLLDKQDVVNRRYPKVRGHG